MEIIVCVGSSCHLKGSHDVVVKLQKLINEYNLDNIVVLKASFCMGNCAKDGVALTIDNEFIENCNSTTIEEIFMTKVLRKYGD